MPKRKCSMCGQRKPEFMPLSGGWGCRDCCSSAGMSAPKNVAKANSKKWQDGPCPHQATANYFYYKGFTRYMGTKCRRCGHVLFQGYPVSHHGKRR